MKGGSEDDEQHQPATWDTMYPGGTIVSGTYTDYVLDPSDSERFDKLSAKTLPMKIFPSTSPGNASTCSASLKKPAVPSPASSSVESSPDAVSST